MRERELVPYVVKYLQENGYLVFTERYVGLGRADVIGVKLNITEVEKRINHNVPRLPIRTLLRIMRILSNYREISIKNIAKKLNLSLNYVRKIVLYVNPLFLEYHDGLVRKISDYRPFTKEIVLIEVKVGDWRNGLLQADTYLISGHRSYLAIYRKNYHRIPGEVIEWAKKRGIGILVVNRKGIVKEEVKAKKVGPRSRTSYYVLAESLWNKVKSTFNHFSR